MKTRLALAVFVLFLAGQGVSAANGVISTVDWASPSPGVVTIAGWAFNCALAGQHPWSVRVFYDGINQADVHQRQSGLYRPDVAAAFNGGCGSMNPYVGFTLYVTGIPPGAHTVSVEWADSLGANYNSFEIVAQ